MIARWTQALFAEGSWRRGAPWAPTRLQLYVDDPAAVASGSGEQRAFTFSGMVLWWLVLGVPLSWAKGAVHRSRDLHTWIGVVFTSPARGVARMSLPAPFVAELVQLCRLFLTAKHAPLTAADSLVGKAGRVVYVLPQTRPFVAALYEALSASLKARKAGAKEAPPNEVACVRFKHGAELLLAILTFDDRRAPVPHSRDVLALKPPPPNPAVLRFEVDASPWGGGGVMYVCDRPTRCFAIVWVPADFAGMDVEIGSPAAQTFFEVVVLVLAVELWADGVRPAAILGDSVSALQEVVSLKGKGLHAPVSQALSRLMVSRSLSLTVGHLPAEANTAADALSRQAESKNPKPWPFRRGQEVQVDEAVRPSTLWSWLG